MSRSKRNGLVGDQSVGLGTGSNNSAPDAPEMVPTIFVPTRAKAWTVMLLVGPETVVVTRSFCVSMSGMSLRAATLVAGTGSSHTGCQIPLHEVYMIPPGYSVCLPRGMPAASVGS